MLLNPQGSIHGGVMVAVFDISMGHLLNKTDGMGATIEMKIQYLRPVRQAESSEAVYQKGRTISFMESLLSDDTANSPRLPQRPENANGSHLLQGIIQSNSRDALTSHVHVGPRVILGLRQCAEMSSLKINLVYFWRLLGPPRLLAPQYKCWRMPRSGWHWDCRHKIFNACQINSSDGGSRNVAASFR